MVRLILTIYKLLFDVEQRHLANMWLTPKQTNGKHAQTHNIL